MKTVLQLPGKTYEVFRAHLLSREEEMAGFLFTRVSQKDGTILFDFLDMDLVQEHELKQEGYYGLELGEDVWNRVMARASQLKASIIEAHSHPFSMRKVGFSGYDMKGFQELVPHLWWRMKGVPYGALVFGQRDYDALFWIENPQDPSPLKYIATDTGRKVRPTNTTLKYYERSRRWKKKSLPGR